jgi:hypothetical protein
MAFFGYKSYIAEHKSVSNFPKHIIVENFDINLHEIRYSSTSLWSFLPFIETEDSLQCP